jgi:5-(carboxyamino)imidazole ribonucleotide synthase
MSAAALSPGSTIGILGGGQLGRMLALAAAPLGFKCHIYAPESDSPAFQVSAAHTIAPFDDERALAAFAAVVDAVTYEFENVPANTVGFLEGRVAVRPGAKALAVAQDRLKEKDLARELGALTANFAAVNSSDELCAAVETVGVPGILKTTRLGYDGKGQAKINGAVDCAAAWGAIKGEPAIYERFVSFDREVSVIMARDAAGNTAAYDVTENVHRNHILRTATVPARIAPEIASEAIYVAKRMAEALDYVGVMGVEFFVGGDVLYVNEIAPRVHNSGHWTMDGCQVSQFAQHIRAVAGWPLGPATRHADVVMTNLLGDEAGEWARIALEPGAVLHLYGKAEARPGRKMGHVNRVLTRVWPRQS